jgi:hypothetical protein
MRLRACWGASVGCFGVCRVGRAWLCVLCVCACVCVGPRELTDVGPSHTPCQRRCQLQPMDRVAAPAGTLDQSSVGKGRRVGAGAATQAPSTHTPSKQHPPTPVPPLQSLLATCVPPIPHAVPPNRPHSSKDRCAAVWHTPQALYSLQPLRSFATTTPIHPLNIESAPNSEK